MPKKVVDIRKLALYNIATARENKPWEAEMKCKEFKSTIEDALDAYDGFSHKVVRIYMDVLDAIEEGYIEGLEEKDVTYKFGKMRVWCTDGIVWIKEEDGEIVFNLIEDQIPLPKARTHRAASPYERTRAMVYATGNKWAIENFNLTH